MSKEKHHHHEEHKHEEHENVQNAVAQENEKKENAEVKEEKTFSAEEKIAELEKQIDELKKANADLKDQVLRRAADFDNYRKRAIQEKQEAFDFANTNLLKDLLESLDNFDRTVEAAATATDPKSIADGVKMINKSLISMLENKYNLVAYGVAGDAFDPDIHEAIGSSQDPVASPVLKIVYLKGYKLKDRVIRHAKVMVSMPDGTVSQQPSEEKKETEEQK
ncbi:MULTISPECIES: nucleotide exchange factor GrpE [unclassified Treponema]|uniref:nucleotide exchange factor GrpE n=1 Tax=unclassified Treponema TaxID=2638727 RepID=UPI0025FFD8CC|nr:MULTISPECIES: nucleotide exchange factor GrpE [unclassified Treponema]